MWEMTANELSEDITENSNVSSWFLLKSQGVVEQTHLMTLNCWIRVLTYEAMDKWAVQASCRVYWLPVK